MKISRGNLHLISSRPEPSREEGYDYSKTGLYLVSLYSMGEEYRLTEISFGQPALNDTGHIVYRELLKTAGLRPRIRLDRFNIAKNSVWAIIAIDDCPRFKNCGKRSNCRGRGVLCQAPIPGRFGKPSTGVIWAIVDHLKISTTRRISLDKGRIIPEGSLWQQGHFEKPIRNDKQLDHARKFIRENISLRP